MDLREASQIVADYEGAVKSGKYLDWNLSTLLEIQGQLREARATRIQWGYAVEPCDAVLEKINRAIELRQNEERALAQKIEDDKKAEEREQILKRRFWIQISIASAGVVLAVLFGVLHYRASTPPATPRIETESVRPSTSPSPQTTPLQPTPAPTATASPTIAPTASPAQSPRLSPTPAP